MRHNEINQVTRWYPTEFDTIYGEDIFGIQQSDMYVHIPFCDGKCSFCPFNSKPINKQNLNDYFSALKKEIMMYATEPYLETTEIKSLWIGGGTPSAVPFSNILEIINLIEDKFHFASNIEITLETNIHDLNEKYIREVVKSKVNRLSIGIQSFLPKYLKMMGRSYSLSRIDEFFSFIGNYNLDISIDLMFRYPGQTVSDIHSEIDAIEHYSKKIDHITLYSLILFPKLGIYKKVANGELPKQPSLNVYEKMFNILHDRLKKLDFSRYTPNHFAKKSKLNIYNIDRWGFPQKECIAFGPGAFGYINGYVYCNEHDIKNYYMKIDENTKPIQMGKKINCIEQASRYLVLGVRLRDIDLLHFEKLTGINPLIYYKKEIDVLLKDNLILIDNNHLIVTKKGCNYILDVCTQFETKNNLLHVQPQYEILDMFEGDAIDYSKKVIDDNDGGFNEN